VNVLAERDTDIVVADTAALAGRAATLADVVAALADVAANMPAATTVVLMPASSESTRNFFLMIKILSIRDWTFLASRTR
jgi:hypothetical protein